VPARDTGYQTVHALRKRITFADSAVEKVVGVLPAYATVVGGGVHIITAFNAGTTNTIDVGRSTQTADDNCYATALTAGAVGFIALDELAATTNIQQTAECTVIATYDQTGGAATAGVADVIVLYVLPHGAAP